MREGGASIAPLSNFRPYFFPLLEQRTRNGLRIRNLLRPLPRVGLEMPVTTARE